jgi:hypothetical protein
MTASQINVFCHSNILTRFPTAMPLRKTGTHTIRNHLGT